MRDPNEGLLSLRNAVEADEIERALTAVGFSRTDLVRATGATHASASDGEASGATHTDPDERIRELAGIVLLLSETMTTRGARLWLQAPNRLLGRRCPIDAIAAGDGDSVRDAARSFVDGAYA